MITVVGFLACSALFGCLIHVPSLRQAESQAAPARDDQRVFVESYWLIGVAKIALGLLFGVGSAWSIYGIEPIWQEWWIIVPSAALGVSGVMDLAFRCRHTFYVSGRRVRVDGYRLGRGSFARSFDYSQLRWAVAERSGSKSPRYCALLIFPGFEVSYYSGPDERTVQGKLAELVLSLGLEEPNQPPATR